MAEREYVCVREYEDVGSCMCVSRCGQLCARIKMWAVVCAYQDVDSCGPAFKACCVSVYASTFQKPDRQLQVSMHITSSAYELVCTDS